MVSSSSVCGPLRSPSSNSSDSREPTPEYDPAAVYDTVAPPHWDAEGFDFDAPWSEDDASLTDGEEGLQFLADGELEEDSADDYSWEGDEDVGDDADDGADDSDDSADAEGDAGIGDEDEDDDHGGDDDTDGGDDGGDDDADGGGGSSSSGEDGDSDLPPIKRYRRLGYLA